jgi:hypothetical protein
VGEEAMNADSFIKAQLVAFAHREAAHHGGYDNMLAVMHVIRNRQRASWFGGDWIKILHDAPQKAGHVPPPSAVELRDTAVKMAMLHVDDIFNGMAADKFTEGALYYAELSKVDRSWFVENIARDPEHHPRCAQVGPVSFFR